VKKLKQIIQWLSAKKTILALIYSIIVLPSIQLQGKCRIFGNKPVVKGVWPDGDFAEGCGN
jgi:hypothetical protein